MTDTPRVFLAAYHDGLSPRYEVVPEGAMGAEPWVPEGAGVRVKALEWRDQDDPMGMCSACGSYWAFPSGAWRPSDESYRNVTGIETLEAARAACQAHHEARIRAAIELTTEPEPTSGAYDLICCTAEDVATGRGFTGDAAADMAMAQESLRDCLKLLGWRG